MLDQIDSKFADNSSEQDSISITRNEMLADLVSDLNSGQLLHSAVCLHSWHLALCLSLCLCSLLSALFCIMHYVLCLYTAVDSVHKFQLWQVHQVHCQLLLLLS